MSQPPYDEDQPTFHESQYEHYTPPPPTAPPRYEPTQQLPWVPPSQYGHEPPTQQYGYGPPPQYGPPGQYGYGPPPPPYAAPPPQGPRRRRGLVAGIVAVSVVVVGGLVAAVVVFGHSAGTALGGARPTADLPTFGTPSFPSLSVPSFTIPPFSVPGGPVATPTAPAPSAPTNTSGATPTGPATAEQIRIAANATAFLHGLAAQAPTVFCPLWDPADLAKVLAQHRIRGCSDIELSDEQERDLDGAFAVGNPSAIEVVGSDATIPSDAVSPSGYPYDVVLRKDVDGTWKVVFTAG